MQTEKVIKDMEGNIVSLHGIKLDYIGNVLSKGFGKEFIAVKVDKDRYTLIPKLEYYVSVKQKAPDSGAYGVVNFFHTQNIVSKTCHKREDSPNMAKEIAIYFYLENRIMPKLYNFNESYGKLSMYLEMGKQTLYSYIKNGKKETSVIGKKLAESLFYSSLNGVYHLDLKPGNIIIDASGDVKIIDWGISEVDWRRRGKNEFVQTVGYRAPEIVFENRFYGEKADVFSLAFIILEVELSKLRRFENGEHYIVSLINLFGWKDYTYCKRDNIILYKNKRIREMGITILTAQLEEKERKKEHIIRNIREKYKVSNESLLDLLGSMLEPYPQYRFSFRDVLNHPYIKGDTTEIIIEKRRPRVMDISVCWREKYGKHYREKLFNYLYNLGKKYNQSPETIENAFTLIDEIVLENKKTLTEGISYDIFFTCFAVYDSPNVPEGINVKYAEILKIFGGNIIRDTKYSSLVRQGKTPKKYNCLESYLNADIYSGEF